ncbi:anhydro-N-acetylmuramic acid kinase [Pseudomarimonas salicorniae]|uniref:Anhydro-N-acetylmuramic acid kinase n=1 Tax=Pseudomarimonas salicorniae TaxID=2933270 RepID=A0ABT0GDN1_9GAMM|nr:anhydro-N-acetylmuramic acid kinase [Lysobacter sp. CAU 1642]
MNQAPRDLYLGLISGTSADGIDAALCRFDPHPELLAGLTHPYPDGLREEIIRVSQSTEPVDLDALGRLEQRIASAFAEAARALMDSAGVGPERIAAIGSHGQTIRHRPEGPHPFTWQMGDPSLIAERTRCTVVADFRRRDLAAGGQGAPLLPALHAALLRDPHEDRAVLNLGGIANLTLLPRGGAVRGFDTGPANCLLDAWHARHRGEGYDANGDWAAGGTADRILLEQLLCEPYFARPAPKSTGREMLNLEWLGERGGARLKTLRPQDVQATLLALSIDTVATALLREQPSTQRLLVCGGGARNAALMAGLARRLPGAQVESSAVRGVDPDLVEAMGFAWLAHATLHSRPGNLPEVTGAAGPRILGGLFSA